MRNLRRICFSLLGFLCVAVVPAVQGADGPASPSVVIPEPAVAPLAEGDTLSPEGTVPLLEDRVPPPPLVISAVHSPPGCYSHPACCPRGACRGCLRGFRSRMKWCLQESHWGYPEEFCELPVGARLYAHLNTQVANGTAAQMVLYRYDFHDGILGEAFRLNQRGRTRLRRMGWMLQYGLHPIVVEHTPEEPELAAARRDHVLSSLEKQGFTVPEEWVIVGEPRAAGLSGEEAIGVYQRMLSQQEQPSQTPTNRLMINQGEAMRPQESTASSGP